MRLLLTGSSGFIGRNLLERLLRRFDVLAPKRDELDLLDAGSVRRTLSRSPVDFVVHAATIPGHRNAPTVPDLGLGNIRMFIHLVRAARPSTRFIVLGSGAEYDASRDMVRVREDDASRPVPRDETGFSKLVQSAFAEERGRFTHLRPFGVFGPHEDWEIRFISNALCKSLHLLPITLRQNRRLDYLWVEDLAEIVERFLLRGSGPHAVYNVTPDDTVDLLSLARLVRDTAEAKVPIVVGREGMGLEYTGDNSRLREVFPDLAFSPFPVSVARLFDFYRSRLTEIPRERLLIDR